MLKSFPKKIADKIHKFARDPRMSVARSGVLLNISTGSLHRYCKKNKIEWIHRRQHWKPGIRVGRLLLLNDSGKRMGSEIVWKCLCDCNKRILMRSHRLRSQEVPSCGCYIFERSETSLVNAEWKRCKKGAKGRSLRFELNIEKFKELSKQDCFYCGSPPCIYKSLAHRRIKTWVKNGIDRVDSDLGYVDTNMVPCCKKCNFAKGSMKLYEFKVWVKKVHSHLFSR